MSFLKTKISHLTASIFIVTSGFYVTKLPLSPIYFAMFITLFFLVFILCLKNKIYYNKILVAPVVYIVYVIYSQLFINGDFHTTVNVIMSVMYFIVSLLIIYDLSTERIVKISKKCIQYSIPLLIIEAIYRLTHPIYILSSGFDYRTEENQFIYPYKLNSIMYQDSNFVGIYILALFFFANYLTDRHCLKFRVEKIILVCLLFLTISRAAIISLMLFVVVFYVWKKKNRLLKYSLFILSLILFVCGLIDIASDESFQTKFQLIDMFFQFLSGSDLFTLLFGVGYGNTVNIFGMGAHNFFITHIVESGIVGFSLLFIFWMSIVASSSNNALVVMLPFLLVGMSLAGHAIPYMYSFFAIIIILERNLNDTIQ